MNPSAIYSKTGKGVQEATGKTRELQRGDRAVLAAIDGKSTVAEVGQKLGRAEDDDKFVQLFERLERDGFIRLIAGAPAAAAEAPSGVGGAGARAATAPGEDLDFTRIAGTSRPSAAPSPKVVVDLAAHARAEAERKAREEAELRGAADAARVRAEAEAKVRAAREAAKRAAAESAARAEAEARARAEAEARARKQTEERGRREAELLAKIAEAERLAKEAEERTRRETEGKAQRELEEMRGRLEAERQARVDAERKAREEAERRAREEAERRAREEAERKAREEAERKAREEAELRAREEAERRAREEAEREAREDAERKAREEAELRAREEAERKAREEAERRAREEAERKAREEAERKAREEAELRAREEAERRAREEAERKAREQAERKAREEAERKAREEAELRAREEADRKAKEEAARRAREEAERKAREEAERKAREEAALRAREEADRKAKEEAARRAREEAERKAREEAEQRDREEAERRAREETDRRRREQEQVAAREAQQPEGVDLAAALIADLDRFSEQEQEQRRAQEQDERRVREEAERKANEEAERKARQEAESRAREDAKRSAKQAAELKVREEQSSAQREAERMASSQPAMEEPRPAREDGARRGKAKRRLAAIVASDVVGYSRLMGIDEEGTLARFRRILDELIRPAVEEHGGRIVKTAGDGLLLEFPSVVEAARWAADVQTAVANDQVKESPARQIAMRMGVNLGDVIEQDNDVFGDGVNVAARLESLAERGGICISGVVYDHIHDKVPGKFEDIGPQKLKNIARPVRVYRMRGEWETVSLRRTTDLKSLPHASAMAGAASESAEVEVGEEDLDTEEVKRDQQALTAGARTLAREREHVRETTPAASKPSKIRLPKNWGRLLAVALVVLVAAVAVALQFMPVPTAEYERAAAVALGQRVRIHSAHVALWSGLKLSFEGITIGDAVKIGKASVPARPGALFGAQRSFASIELDDVVAPQTILGNVLFGKMGGAGLGLERVTLHRVTLQGPLQLPPLDAELALSEGGARSVQVHGPGNLSLQLAPSGDKATFEATAESFAPPFLPALTMSNFAMKGGVDRAEITVTHFDAQLYDGTIAGDARIRWSGGWSVGGSLQVKAINAAVFAPALLSQGTADASGNYSLHAANAGGPPHAHLDGRFTIDKGVLGSFDLARAVQTKGGQAAGFTPFAHMSGEGSYDDGAVRLSNLTIGAGALNAGVSADIEPSGELRGRIVADMKAPAHTLSVTLQIGGTLQAPQVVSK